jgi:hypothetical protein|tara:strand:+ start:2649 stop:3254 length:606 start_codon:yes stop_codon:yes gene_type:complete
MNSIILSTNVLEEVGISAVEFLFLHFIHTEENFGMTFNEIDVEKLQEKKLIKISSKNEIILRQQSIDLIEFSLIEVDISFNNKKKKVTKSSRTINKEVDDFVDEFRHKWHGLKAGAMGGKQACVQKLTRWMKDNPTVTPEKILSAADLYLSTEGRDVRFLQRADYFIYKQDSGRSEASRLSAYVDDIVIGTTNDDWTTKLN